MGECSRNPGWMLTGCPVACKQCGNQVGGRGDGDYNGDLNGDDNEDMCFSAKTTTPTVRLGLEKASAARTKPIWTSTVQR